MISNFSLWFINGVSSYFIILPLTLFFTSLNFWERNTSVIQIVINLFVLDLWTYWWHRINHIIPFLWRFHLIHHLDEHLDVTSALRFHFGEVFLSVLARGILIIGLAIPFSDILIFETLLLICAIFHHSNLKLPKIIEKPLSLIIILVGLSHSVTPLDVYQPQTNPAKIPDLLLSCTAWAFKFVVKVNNAKKNNKAVVVIFAVMRFVWLKHSYSFYGHNIFHKFLWLVF